MTTKTKTVLPVTYVNRNGETKPKYHVIVEGSLPVKALELWNDVKEAREAAANAEKELRAIIQPMLAASVEADQKGYEPTLATRYGLQFVFEKPKGAKTGAVSL